ncbi:MAG: hypothetical protein ACKVOQ_18085 [Cyclobacteriaceae bacterium]
MNILNKDLSNRFIERLQILIILAFVIIPLFIQLPFKINLFLAWEGAYRISIGQIPFKDFSLPMGFGFWILPAIFFKIFGPNLYTLVITQVFINLIGSLSLRSILKKLGVDPAIVLLTLLVYCISFVFVNFWPWYNHTVFIFELIAINFLLHHIFSESNKKKIIFIALTSFFLVLAVFTKQDGGALAVLSASALLLYDAIVTKRIQWVLYYAGFSLIFTALFVLPFITSDFLYWFNYGQAPHNARTSLNDILIDVFEGSQWIKFYFMLVIIIIMRKTSTQEKYFRSKKEVLFALFSLCILAQAILVQVTSYIPHNVNIYFHAIAFAFIASNFLTFNINKVWILASICFLIMFWWSADYWRYGQRIINRISPSPSLSEDKRSLNSVSKYTWFIDDSTKQEKKINWKISKYKSFKNVLLPEETIRGIDSIMSLKIIKTKNLKVLNMSELTPLAYEIGYEPLKNQPMWFHRNVSIFDKEIKEFSTKISNKEYDLVLFEVIPNLNQFYPDAVRKSLQENYVKVTSFQAPRDNTKCFIEVYIKPFENQ